MNTNLGTCAIKLSILSILLIGLMGCAKQEPYGCFSASGPVTLGNTVFITTEGIGPFDGPIFAINIRTGEIRWSARGASFNPPLIDKDRIIYTGVNQQMCARKTDTGQEIWSIAPQSQDRRPTSYSPLSKADEFVYTGTSNDEVVARNYKDGRLIWSYNCRRKDSAIKPWLQGIIRNIKCVGNGLVAAQEFHYPNYYYDIFQLDRHTGKRKWIIRCAGAPLLLTGQVCVALNDNAPDNISRELTVVRLSDGTILWNRVMPAISSKGYTTFTQTVFPVSDRMILSEPRERGGRLPVELVGFNGKTIWKTELATTSLGFVIERSRNYLLFGKNRCFVLDKETGALSQEAPLDFVPGYLPTVLEDKLFCTTAKNEIAAVDLRTLKRFWLSESFAPTNFFPGFSGQLAIVDNLVLAYCQTNGNLYALDQFDGHLVWKISTLRSN